MLVRMEGAGKVAGYEQRGRDVGIGICRLSSRSVLFYANEYTQMRVKVTVA
jgi:hypothetical protein